MNAGVVTPPGKTMVKFKDRCFQLEIQNMEVLEHAECCSGSQLQYHGWEPAFSKELLSIWKCDLTVAVVDCYRMDPEGINDYKVITKCILRT
jgi:hypothetical protein